MYAYVLGSYISMSKMQPLSTDVFHCYDAAGIREKYHNIQTIEISSINF